MARYYGYMRVSTETQAEKGGGLETQRQNIEKYCTAHGIEISAWFTDAGISGAAADNATDEEAISKRVGLLDMLATLEEGDTVIVLNTSRLWRSKATSFIIPRELINKKAHVISIEQPNYDLYNMNPNDRFFEIVMEALDELERANIALKLAKGRAAKAKNGNKPCGVTPYGYEWSSDKKSVVINQAEAATVKKMFSLGQTGESLQRIANAINATGARTRHGKEFSKGTIAAILNNRFYLGELTHAGVSIQGNQPAIISRVQFGKVQAALAKRKRG